MNCFGGAAASTACLVADALGMTEVLIHRSTSPLIGVRHGARRHPRTRQQAIRRATRRQGPPALKHEAAGQQGRHARGSPDRGVPPAKIKGDRRDAPSATTAPTRREWSKAGTMSKMKSAFEKAKGPASASSTAAKRNGGGGLFCVGRSDRGRRAKFRERSHQATRNELPRPAHTTKFFSKCLDTSRRLHPRALSHGHKVKGPAIVIRTAFRQ